MSWYKLVYLKHAYLSNIIPKSKLIELYAFFIKQLESKKRQHWINCQNTLPNEIRLTAISDIDISRNQGKPNQHNHTSYSLRFLVIILNWKENIKNKMQLKYHSWSIPILDQWLILKEITYNGTKEK